MIDTINAKAYLWALNEKGIKEHEKMVREQTEKQLYLDRVQSRFKLNYFKEYNSLVCNLNSVLTIAKEIYPQCTRRFSRGEKETIELVKLGKEIYFVVRDSRTNYYDYDYEHPNLLIDIKGNIINLYAPKEFKVDMTTCGLCGYNKEMLNVFETKLEDFVNEFNDFALSLINSR
jgi:hypothetical protein